MMNADKDRLKVLLTETITLLCQRGLTFKRELRVQGLLGITVDDEVFLVSLDDKKSHVVQPWFINCEAEATSPCHLIPRQSKPVVHQMVMSEVPDVNSAFLSAARNPSPCPQFIAADNESSLPTVVKAEILDDENIRCSTGSKIQLLNNGLNENLSAAVQMQTGSGGARPKVKRKRKRCKFGNDILVLSPDNDEWTDVNQRESNEAAVTYSQWANYAGFSVSIFKSRDLFCSLCCH